MDWLFSIPFVYFVWYSNIMIQECILMEIIKKKQSSISFRKTAKECDTNLTYIPNNYNHTISVPQNTMYEPVNAIWVVLLVSLMIWRVD